MNEILNKHGRTVRNLVAGGIIIAGNAFGLYEINQRVSNLEQNGNSVAADQANRISVLEKQNGELKGQILFLAGQAGAETDLQAAELMHICGTDQVIGILPPDADCQSLVDGVMAARDQDATDIQNSLKSGTPQVVPVPEATPAMHMD